MSRIFSIRDATNQSRNVKQIHVADAAGTVRHIKAGYVYDSLGNPQQFYPMLNVLTLNQVASQANSALEPFATVGYGIQKNRATFILNTALFNTTYQGYQRLVAGSVSPSPVLSSPEGRQLEYLYTDTATQRTYLRFSGFPSDPGVGWAAGLFFTRTTVPLGWQLIAGVPTYSYSAGSATWWWFESELGLGANLSYNMCVVKAFV